MVQAWSSLPDMPVARYDHTMAATPDGKKVVCAGGEGADWDTKLKSVVMFDFSTQAWTSLPDMPEERESHTMAATLDGKKLVCAGGCNGMFGSNKLKSVVMFDFNTQAWTSLPDMPEERYDHTMAATPDGKLVCAGGVDAGGTRLKSVVMFDFSTQAWTPLPDMPEERTDHAMAATPDGKLVCTGGVNASNTKLMSVVTFTLDMPAGLQLRLWWSDPEVDAGEHRVLCRPRRQMVWMVMHVAERLEILPSEMWMLIFTFVKHEHPPTGPMYL